MNHRPPGPVGAYPKADLPPVPPTDPELGPAEARPVVRREVEVAALDFLNPDAMRTVVELTHPFRWSGRAIHQVTIRMLSAGEVGRIVSRVSGEDDQVELYDFYAAMTGLPAPVLRGMTDVDNIAVTEGARPFLPRLVTALFFGPSSDAGDATASSPSEP